MLSVAPFLALTPPRPVLQFFQSKDRYFNQSQLLSVAREYVARGIPISVIVVDWFHWLQLGDASFNPACWPDPQAMVDELQGQGINLMVTFWPFMNSSSVNWPVFDQSNWLATKESTGKHDMFWTYLQSGALVDTTNVYAQRAVFEKFWENYGSLGVKAVWLDEVSREGRDFRKVSHVRR
jgi:alpha-D-xyloside xylohydrolase